MKLQDIIDTYYFFNIGQFRAMARSAGYSEYYKSGTLRFSKSGEDDQLITFSDIRTWADKKINEESTVSKLLETSMSELTGFYDRGRSETEFYAYSQELKDKGIELVKWDNLKAGKEKDVKQSVDGYTIIDHNHKIAYTGKSFYEYAYNEGYALDGTGQMLGDGDMSQLTTIEGKRAKLQRAGGNTYAYMEADRIIIPPKIGDHVITPEEEQYLMDGKTIVIDSKGKRDIYLHIDREIGAIVVSSNKEFRIPDEMAGYKLTNIDKSLLANKMATDRKLFHGPEGSFLAELFSVENGLGFKNVRHLTKLEVEQYNKSIEQNKNATKQIQSDLKELANIKSSSGRICELLSMYKDNPEVTEKMAKIILNNFSFEEIKTPFVLAEKEVTMEGLLINSTYGQSLSLPAKENISIDYFKAKGKLNPIDVLFANDFVSTLQEKNNFNYTFLNTKIEQGMISNSLINKAEINFIATSIIDGLRDDQILLQSEIEFPESFYKREEMSSALLDFSKAITRDEVLKEISKYSNHPEITRGQIEIFSKAFDNLSDAQNVSFVDNLIGTRNDDILTAFLSTEYGQVINRDLSQVKEIDTIHSLIGEQNLTIAKEGGNPIEIENAKDIKTQIDTYLKEENINFLYEREIIKTLNRDDFSKMVEISEKGFKPSESFISSIEKMDMSSDKKIAFEQIFEIPQKNKAKKAKITSSRQIGKGREVSKMQTIGNIARSAFSDL